MARHRLELSQREFGCIIGRDWLSLLGMSWNGPKGAAELRTPRQ